MTRLKPCRECGIPIAQMAEICPHCGADAPALRSWAYGCYISAGAVGVVLGLLVVLLWWIFL